MKYEIIIGFEWLPSQRHPDAAARADPFVGITRVESKTTFLRWLRETNGRISGGATKATEAK